MNHSFEIHMNHEMEAELAQNLVQQYLKQAGIAARVHHNRTIVNVLDPHTGKGNSLNRLMKLQNLQPEQILAIGDSLNDLDMLDGRYGFLSGAVGNAAPLIKAAVAGNKGVIALSPAGKGVSEIIMQYRENGCI